MEKTGHTPKPIFVAIIAMGVAALLFAGWSLYTKSALQDALNEELLKSESLLSEKLLLDKEIDKNKREIGKLNENNQYLDKELDALTSKLSTKEEEIKSMMRNNAKVAQLQKELTSLKQIRSDFETQLNKLKTDAETLLAENQSLKSQKAEAQELISILRSDNAKLSQNLEILSSLAQNTLLEVSKKNQKLTINARRAKRITLSFDVPAGYYDQIDVRIIDPKESEYTRKDGSISYKEIAQNGEATASIKPAPGASDSIKRLQVTYAPKTKLSTGIYKADVYNNNVFIGRVQVKLR